MELSLGGAPDVILRHHALAPAATFVDPSERIDLREDGDGHGVTIIDHEEIQ